MTTTAAGAALIDVKPSPRYIDVLPVRGGKRQSLEWIPHSEEAEHGEGFVVLTSDKDRTSYAVAQTHGEPYMLGFVFSKVSSTGTDAKRPAYLLTCTRSGSEPKCDCAGFARHGHCRHADSLQTLFANRWLSSGESY